MAEAGMFILELMELMLGGFIVAEMTMKKS